jgi:hypothetical protein
MNNNIDYQDGYDERMNPYNGVCSRHGAWKGSYDECPQCMKEEYDHDEENISPSICWNCRFGSDPSSYVYCQRFVRFESLAQKPRKNHCKYFKEFERDFDILNGIGDDFDSI